MLGMSIENASEHHQVINVKVGVQENFANVKDIMDSTAKVVDEQKEAI